MHQRRLIVNFKTRIRNILNIYSNMTEKNNRKMHLLISRPNLVI